VEWNSPHLPTLLTQVWTKLGQACNDTVDPWHTPVLGTLNGNRPALRTMVIRAVESTSRNLVCYSDIRAAKVRQMLDYPVAEWLFYDTQQGVQLRASGKTTVHNQNHVTKAAWKSKPVMNHLPYVSPLPPGTGLPASLPSNLPDLKEHELAYQNFAVIVTTIHLFDLLLLGESKDRRAAFSWDGEQFSPTWMVP
jgi:hypothetical protein